MSRIGKLPIPIPAGVTVNIDASGVTVKGPKGELYQDLRSEVEATIEENELVAETHIFDFNKDIYGETIMVDFVQRLRDEIKFSGIPELVKQIDLDITQAKAILSPHFEH